jgi:hypothetical protein
MIKTKFEMGDRVKSKISGFTGEITRISVNRHGEASYVISASASDQIGCYHTEDLAIVERLLNLVAKRDRVGCESHRINVNYKR